MNNRHVQTFLMVSAAFFSMSGPLRSEAATLGGNTTAADEIRVVPVAPADQTELSQVSLTSRQRAF